MVQVKLKSSSSKVFSCCIYILSSLYLPPTRLIVASVALPLFSQHSQVKKLFPSAPVHFLQAPSICLPDFFFSPFPHRFKSCFGLCCQGAIRVVLDTEGRGYTQTHTITHSSTHTLEGIKITIGSHHSSDG